MLDASLLRFHVVEVARHQQVRRWFGQVDLHDLSAFVTDNSVESSLFSLLRHIGIVSLVDPGCVLQLAVVASEIVLHKPSPRRTEFTCTFLLFSFLHNKITDERGDDTYCWVTDNWSVSLLKLTKRSLLIHESINFFSLSC